MYKLSFKICLAVSTALICFIMICRLFDTTFALASIDWISFLAGAFLLSDALYKLRKLKNSPPPIYYFRFFRILIGICIILVHITQHVWGTGSKPFELDVIRGLIDWSAFFFGMFLMLEGTLRLVLTRKSDLIDQTTRLFRVAIGASICAIHLLQFIRD